MNWLLAIVIVSFLFIGGCALWIQAASESTSEFMDFAERSFCYDSGFTDARYGNERRPPTQGREACDDFYSDGYSDGLGGGYDPPESSE